MLNYPAYMDRYSSMDYPSQEPWETFRAWQDLFIHYQTDIWGVRDEYLLSNVDKDWETSFS